MIHIRTPIETKPYLPQATTLAWIKTQISGLEAYRLETVQSLSANNLNAGSGQVVSAKTSLLESGAVLASFPLLGKLPGSIQPDPFTTWFELDAPALLPEGIFGLEIEIGAGRHLLASSLGTWVVFFKPINPVRFGVQHNLAPSIFINNQKQPWNPIP
jgi:hypothetical protein